MIILITGQPGAGKTALCVDMLANDPQFAGRPIFASGIPDLKLEHSPAPPVAEWTELRTSPDDESIRLAYFTFPAGSLVVLDEAQRVYRPRAVGSKVPAEVAAFETHRHTGVDFILLTQHPGLLDANIRKLIGRHIHIAVTPFGRKKYEWTKCADPDSKTERDISASSSYTLPKRAFDLYKSAELHTKIKAKIPFYFWLLIAAVLAFILTIALVYRNISSKVSHQEQPRQEQTHQPGDSPRQAQASSVSVSAKEYNESLVPRVPGMYHTAPRYDQITQPNDAPWPAGCWISRDVCKCVDQVGNRYQIAEAQCRSIVANGIFKDWQSPSELQDRDAPQARRGPGSDRPQAAPAI